MNPGWIDVHAHFTPPLTAEQSDARWEGLQAIGWIGAKPADWDVDVILSMMDRQGISMQMLSNIPKSLDALKASNDYGAALVARHPTRFGLLAAIPTDDPDAALVEIDRAVNSLDADGFAVTFNYNGTKLSDPRLDPVWAAFDRLGAPVFAHPDGYCPGSFGRPSAVLDVTWETTLVTVDMMYAGTFRRFPNVKFILAHCGGALPALSGRLALLGAEPWVTNPQQLTSEEMQALLRSFYYDTAMAGSMQSIAPVMAVAGCGHILYGSDSGVPCSTEQVIGQNITQLSAGLSAAQVDQIGTNAFRLFPKAAARCGRVVSA